MIELINNEKNNVWREQILTTMETAIKNMRLANMQSFLDNSKPNLRSVSKLQNSGEERASLGLQEGTTAEKIEGVVKEREGAKGKEKGERQEDNDDESQDDDKEESEEEDKEEEEDDNEEEDNGKEEDKDEDKEEEEDVEEDNKKEQEEQQSCAGKELLSSSAMLKRSGPAPKSNPSLHAVTIAFSSEISKDNMVNARNNLYTNILEKKFMVRKNNRSVTQKMSPETALEITNWFFGEMMGIKGFNRLQNLVVFYGQTDEAGLDVGVAARAEKLANDSRMGQEFQGFFSTFAAVQRQESWKGNVTLSHINRCCLLVDLLASYQRLATGAKSKNSKV